MTDRDEQLIRAALEMAAQGAEAMREAAATAVYESVIASDIMHRWTSAQLCADAIRAIPVAEVLAKVGDDRCAKCGHPRNDHPLRHQFVSKGNAPSANIPALCAEIERLRAALDAVSVASGDDFWNCGGIARAALAACKGVRDELPD